jgi:hypothetical protein
VSGMYVCIIDLYKRHCAFNTSAYFNVPQDSKTILQVKLITFENIPGGIGRNTKTVYSSEVYFRKSFDVLQYKVFFITTNK